MTFIVYRATNRDPTRKHSKLFWAIRAGISFKREFFMTHSECLTYWDTKSYFGRTETASRWWAWKKVDPRGTMSRWLDKRNRRNKRSTTRK